MATFFFSSRRRHTRCLSDWSSDVCSSDLAWRLPRPAPRGSCAAPPCNRARGRCGRQWRRRRTARPEGTRRTRLLTFRPVLLRESRGRAVRFRPSQSLGFTSRPLVLTLLQRKLVVERGIFDLPLFHSMYPWFEHSASPSGSTNLHFAQFEPPSGTSIPKTRMSMPNGAFSLESQR